MGLSWFLQHTAPMTNPAKTCTRTPAPARNKNPAPWQFSGSDQTCTATLRQYPFCNICYILTDSFHLSTLYRDTRLFDQNLYPDGKNHAIPSLHRVSFVAPLRGVPGQIPVLSSGNTTYLYCRAVSLHSNFGLNSQANGQSTIKQSKKLWHLLH